MRVRTKNDTCALPFGGRYCNPESRANIPGEQDDSVKVGMKNQAPNSWVKKAEERP
jgi:hypothetical protein